MDAHIVGITPNENPGFLHCKGLFTPNESKRESERENENVLLCVSCILVIVFDFAVAFAWCEWTLMGTQRFSCREFLIDLYYKVKV